MHIHRVLQDTSDTRLDTVEYIYIHTCDVYVYIFSQYVFVFVYVYVFSQYIQRVSDGTCDSRLDALESMCHPIAGKNCTCFFVHEHVYAKYCIHNIHICIVMYYTCIIH